PAFNTQVTVDATRKIITRNESPDIGFDRSINPYRGCEHGCIYCFARPTHAFLGLSPGLDFESKLFVKPEAAELLEKELSAPGYEPKVIAIGTNTDPYQPIERRYKVMRRILEVLDRANHPVGIVTKSALVLRDLDILARMAERKLAKVALSVTTLDPELARKMEPRAATPMRRLETLRRLAQVGVPTTVMVAPVVPALNDMEIERILDAAAAAGVKQAAYVLLRLPLEVRDLFREWLAANYPDRANHVFKLIRETRDGKDYDSTWGKRMKGTGPYAWMIGRRFEMACEKLGLNTSKLSLSTDHFRAPKPATEQLNLFWARKLRGRGCFPLKSLWSARPSSASGARSTKAFSRSPAASLCALWRCVTRRGLGLLHVIVDDDRFGWPRRGCVHVGRPKPIEVAAVAVDRNDLVTARRIDGVNRHPVDEAVFEGAHVVGRFHNCLIYALAELHVEHDRACRPASDGHLTCAGAGASAVSAIGIRARADNRTVAETSRILPRPTRCARTARHVSRLVDRNKYGGVAPEFRIDRVAAVFGQRNVGPARTVGFTDFAVEPLAPGRLCMRHQQVALFGTDLARETGRTLADEKLMRELFEHLPRDADRMTKSFQGADRARA